MALRLTRTFNPIRALCQVRMMSDLGSGAGKGGGSGGSVRDAGGAFGKMEAAQEEQYFRKLSAQQMESLKKHHHDEIDNLEKQIKQESDDISRHKTQLEHLKSLIPKAD